MLRMIHLIGLCYVLLGFKAVHSASHVGALKNFTRIGIISSRRTSDKAYVFQGSYFKKTVDDKKYRFPWDKAEPCNCFRLTPISLMSSNAKPIHVSKLVINISNDAEFEFVNGDIIQGILTKGSGTLTGGPLFTDTYDLIQALQRTDAVPEFTRTWGIRDGRGSPVTHDLVFQKEGLTNDEAYETPDGFVIISFPCYPEGNVDNPKFTPYERINRAIREYNASTTALAKDCLPWFLDTLENNCYFSFPGSRYKPPNNPYLYPCVIWIVPSAEIQPTISFRQYYEYLKIKNSAGQPRVSPAPCYQQGNRTIVEICDPVRIHYGR